MEFLLNTAIYLISNAFSIYAMFQFTKVFYTKGRAGSGWIFLGYVVFFLLNSGAYLLFANPLLNILTRLVPFFLISLLYDTKMSTRFLATLTIYAMGMLCDGVMFTIAQWIPFSEVVFSSGFATALALFFVALAAGKLSMIRSNAQKRLPLTYMLALLFVPIGSMIVANVGMGEYDFGSILMAMILLGINVVVFGLYDVLLRTETLRAEKEIYFQQNKYYANQIRLLEHAQENMQFLRHDMKNHLARMSALLQNEEYDKLKGYLQQTIAKMHPASEYLSTGNNDLDCLINYKLSLAEAMGTEITVHTELPQELFVSDFDMTVLMGNLLDNALEALRVCPKKQLDLSLLYQKEMLNIGIRNTYMKEMGKKKRFAAEDEMLHGFGLKSVHQAVQNYNGHMQIDESDTYYTVQVLLYRK